MSDQYKEWAEGLLDRVKEDSLVQVDVRGKTYYFCTAEHYVELLKEATEYRKIQKKRNDQSTH